MWMITDPASGLVRPFRFRNYHRPPNGKDEDGLRHVWYSKKQARLSETIARYRLLDYDIIVDVTTASESPDHGYFWNDMQYLGQGWYVNSYDNPNHHLRGFDSNYSSKEAKSVLMSFRPDSPDPRGYVNNNSMNFVLDAFPITERHLREIWSP